MKHLGKRLLAAGMAAAMVLGSLGVVSAEDSTSSTVTGTDEDVTIGEGFSASTGSVTLSGDFELTYTFTNTGNIDGSSNNWCNYILEMHNGDGDFIDVRADNYGWTYLDATWSADTITYETDWTADWATDTFWTDWLTAMTEGTECMVNVVRSGNTFTITSEAAGGVFVLSTTASQFEGCDTTVYLTGEQCTISDVSYSYTLIEAEDTEAEDTESEEIVYANLMSVDGTDEDVTIGEGFSDNTGSVTISGDFELTYTFTNTGNIDGSSNNWCNYILEMHNGDGDFIDVRADNYGWTYLDATWSTDTITYETDWTADWATDTFWTDWLTVMTAGTECTVNVVRSGNTFTITSEAAGGVFVLSTTASQFEGCDTTVYLTGEQCTISDVSYSYTASTNDYIEFLGGSLRMDYGSDSYDQTSLRFGYTITVPDGATVNSWSWDWGYGGASVATVKGVNYVDNGDGTWTSNVVVTGIPAAYYATELYAQLTVEYTLADGTTVTVTEADAQERSVDDVATAILASGTATDSEKIYAQGILDN